MTMKRFVVRKGQLKYLSALLEVLHKRYDAQVRYNSPRLSRKIEVVVEGVEEESLSREIQAFCKQVDWIVSDN